jgi:hypothetical protein
MRTSLIAILAYGRQIMCHENKLVKFVGERLPGGGGITPTSSPKKAIGASWGRADSAPALSFSASGEAGYIIRTRSIAERKSRAAFLFECSCASCPLVRVLPFERCCG